MSMHPCCRRPAEPPTVSQACLRTAGWVVPGALLIAMPKCPLCLAAYVSLATGISLSFTTAAYLRHSLLAVCLASLAYVAVRTLSRAFRRRADQSKL